MAGRIDPDWRAVRDLSTVMRRASVRSIADAVDGAINEVLPAPPQGVPTDRQALVALIAVLIAAGGSLATAIEADEDVAAWFDHWGPSDTDPEPE